MYRDVDEQFTMTVVENHSLCLVLLSLAFMILPLSFLYSRVSVCVLVHTRRVLDQELYLQSQHYFGFLLSKFVVYSKKHFFPQENQDMEFEIKICQYQLAF
jgi:hypothetical protein